VVCFLVGVFLLTLLIQPSPPSFFKRGFARLLLRAISFARHHRAQTPWGWKGASIRGAQPQEGFPMWRKIDWQLFKEKKAPANP